MKLEEQRVGIGEAAKFLGESENNLRRHEVVADDGKRYLVKDNFRIRVYKSNGGQRR